MKPFTVPGLLRAAASYIEIHGHDQVDGGVRSGRGPCCPIVAFARLGSWTMQFGAAAALAKAIGDLSLPLWSDSTPTAVVLETMRRVARELE